MVNVVIVNLPTQIKEYVVANTDMTYTIVLNARLTMETRLDAYIHAMRHITNGDFDRHRDCSADLVEIYAHE